MELNALLTGVDNTTPSIKSLSQWALTNCSSSENFSALASAIRQRMDELSSQRAPCYRRVSLLMACNDLMHVFLSPEDKEKVIHQLTLWQTLGNSDIGSAIPITVTGVFSKHLLPFLPTLIKLALNGEPTLSDIARVRELVTIWRVRGLIGNLPLEQVCSKIEAESAANVVLPSATHGLLSSPTNPTTSSYPVIDEDSIDPVILALLHRDLPVRAAYLRTHSLMFG